MATKRQRANGTWEFCFQRKGVLPQRVYFTFDTEAEGEAYAERAEEQLARGVVPPEMGEVKWETLQDLFDAYEASGAAGKSDLEMFATVGKAVGKRRLIDTNYNWVEGWTETLSETLAPSSIKKRVEFLGRAIAWGMRREKLSYLNNPVKQLPKGYATKNVAKEKLWAGERDRRLEEREVRVGEEVYQTEEGAIRSVVTEKMETLFLDMALETAMRMREMFTLRLGQIDLKRRTIFLDKTKNGHKRQVPISSVLLKKLETVLADDGAENQLLFPWWDGEEAVERVTNRLSHLFASRFEKAGCADLRFHDLRHEATARIYERTTLSDLEIASITGHKNLRMLQRYANLRASNLVTKMW